MGVKPVVTDCVGVCTCVDETLPVPVSEDEAPCDWVSLTTWLRVLLAVCVAVDVGDVAAELWLAEIVDE